MSQLGNIFFVTLYWLFCRTFGNLWCIEHLFNFYLKVVKLIQPTVRALWVRFFKLWKGKNDLRLAFWNTVYENLFFQLAEVPGAAWINLQPAEHLLFCKQFSKLCPSALSVLGPPGPGGRVNPAPKPFMGRRGCECKISSRSVQGFGFPLTLHTPTDRETNNHLNAHFYM